MGTAGIPFVIAIFALTLRWFRSRANSSLYWFLVYILIIPQAIYVTRADLAGLFSPLLKHAILPLAIVFIVQKVALSMPPLRQDSIQFAGENPSFNEI